MVRLHAAALNSAGRSSVQRGKPPACLLTRRGARFCYVIFAGRGYFCHTHRPHSEQWSSRGASISVFFWRVVPLSDDSIFSSDTTFPLAPARSRDLHAAPRREFAVDARAQTSTTTSLASSSWKPSLRNRHRPGAPASSRRGLQQRRH